MAARDIESFEAKTFDNTTGAGNPVDTQTLLPFVGNLYGGCLKIGVVPAAPPASNNKYVLARANFTDGSQGAPDGHAFMAYQGGSGSCTGSGFSAEAAARPAALANAGKPIPVALSLQADDADAPLQAAVLRYSGPAGDDACWLSAPVASCSDPAAPAFWMLRTADARHWVLLLRRGGADLVAYHVTAGKRGASFPMRLRLADGGDARAWPRTVVLAPAP